MIGTLAIDLSEGVELEQAVKAFEAKVAPQNYKRPKALITPSMVTSAMKTITELGIEPSLERRHATLSDVSVNDVLWVSGKAKDVMKSGIEGLLMSAAKPKSKVPASVTDISIDTLLADVLPNTKKLEVFVANAQQGNFVSVTAPAHADAPNLFKWDNGFGWSYAGEVADASLRSRVAELGGRVDGALRFSHTWNYDGQNQSLMDLHVFMPGSSEHTDGQHDQYPRGRRVGWNARNEHHSGGVQDVDFTSPPGDRVPVENITFPDLYRMPEGVYTFKIHNWKFRAPTTSGFKAEIEFGGQVFQYERVEPLKDKEWVTLAQATLKNGKFTIRHVMTPGAASVEKWGIHTETFVEVDTLMLSPNHWGESAVGNKHYFFLASQIKNPEPCRGIYNEFLRGDLDQHRRVFEVLGSKTRVEPADTQLSGLGFSSTRQDVVVIRADGRTFNVQF